MPRVAAARSRRVGLLHIMTAPQTLQLIGGQVDWLRRRGFVVSVISSPGAALDRFAAEHEVEARGVPMPRRISPFSDLRALVALVGHIRALRPDIVHAHTPKAGLLGMLAAAVARPPVRVYQARGLLADSVRGPRRLLFDGAERLASRLAQRVICQSPSLRRTMAERRLCAASRSLVLGPGSNGVDAQRRFNPDRVANGAEPVRRRLGIGADALVIGFLGRLVRDKGIGELAAAWLELRRVHRNLHLILVGPFERRDPVPPTVEQALREDPRVHLVGLVEDPVPFYRAMDVVALPSYREGFPNVPLEAAAMRLPVVATAVPGCVDAVVDGRTGTLVPVRDAAALAAALRGYLESAELRRRHGEAGRRRVLEEYRPERIWEELLALYDELLAAARQRSAERLTGARTA